MRASIAGIVQGSRTGRRVEGHDYRHEIAEAVRGHVPGVEVLDPLELVPA